VTESLSTSEHRLARVAGSAIKVLFSNERTTRVSVPCLPEVKVLERDLGSRLLMAALLECRDMRRVELRLAEPPGSEWKRMLDMRGSVRVTPLAGPTLYGLCGRILEHLEPKGEQSARRLLSGVTGRNDPGSPYDAGWVIVQVESELADCGYMRRPSFGVIVADCERIQTLAEECALAVDRWNRAWAADAGLCYALLADCTVSLTPKTPIVIPPPDFPYRLHAGVQARDTSTMALSE
jgi:hypothetical protein